MVNSVRCLPPSRFVIFPESNRRKSHLDLCLRTCGPHRLPPVDSLDQHRYLCRRQRDGSFFGLRPHEATPLEPLGIEHETSVGAQPRWCINELNLARRLDRTLTARRRTAHAQSSKHSRYSLKLNQLWGRYLGPPSAVLQVRQSPHDRRIFSCTLRLYAV